MATTTNVFKGKTKAEKDAILLSQLRKEVVYVNGEVVERNGVKTTSKPKVAFRRTYSAKSDFTANALRAVLPHVLSEVFSEVVTLENSVLVRTAEKDYVVKVSKLKFREESEGLTAKSPLAKAVVAMVNTLDGLTAIGSTNRAVLVETNNFEQYEIKIVTKRDRVEL